MPASSIPVNESTLRNWQNDRFGMFIHWGPVSLTGQEMSFSFWVKLNTQPFMGDVINVSGGMGVSGFALDLVQSCLNFCACGHSEPLSSSLLTGWTHYVITANGRSQVTMPFKAKLSFRDNFRLAGGSYRRILRHL